MELNETSSEGAVRETREEAEAGVRVDAPYAYWDIPTIGQVRMQRPTPPQLIVHPVSTQMVTTLPSPQMYILFRATLLPPFTHGAGTESLETRLFEPQVRICS